MNLQEFSALKPGDKVTNAYSGSTGEITEATPSGVRVKWSEHSPPFFYSVQTTAWTHWTKAEIPPEICNSCGRHQAEFPSKLCVGCQAYREHQS